MVTIHVEVVTLEWMTVHTGVYGPKIELPFWVFVKVDDHLEGCDMDRLEDNVVAVGSEFNSRDVGTVVIATVGNFSMEEELQRGLTPWKISVLALVQVSPSPIFWAL